MCVVAASVITLPDVSAQSACPGLLSMQDFGAIEGISAAVESLSPQLEAPLAVMEEDFTPAPAAASRSRVKAAASVSDLDGDYVLVYKGYNDLYNDGGNSVTITAIEGTDSVLIDEFWGLYQVKAYVDISSQTLYIPNQILGSSSTYGQFDMAYCTSSTINRTRNIEAEILSDGTISFTTMWGVFYCDSGDYYNKTYAIYEETTIEPANATMTQHYYDTSTGDTLAITYNVIVSQPSTRSVVVRNFANHGRDIEIRTRKDSTATIDYQVAYATSAGYYYTCSTVYSSSMSLSAAYYVIYCDKAADARTISWGCWTLYNPSGYVMSLCFDGTINVPFDIEYPVSSVSSLSGDGTADSPYLITTVDELQYFGDAVNYSTDYAYGSDGNIALPYRGQYVRLDADLSLSGVDFDPIGQDDYHRFGGTFDGNGHTISNVSINTGYLGYAALFGRCDTLSVIKNLYVDSVTTTTASAYAAGIVGWTYGTVENCHVSNATITCSVYYGAAGIASSAMTVTGCTATGCYITAMGGYGGGIAGQILSSISECGVTDTYIYASGLSTVGYPSGGVMGYLYKGTATDCYFSGTIDTTEGGTSGSGEYAGGVVGYNYLGTVERCFATGKIVEAAYNGRIGGVVGYAGGSFKNCYFTGTLTDAKSENVGGIAGYVGVWKSNGVTYQTEFTNCYAAAQITSDVDDYDTATGCRETLGTVASTASPVVENVYFDNQITNLGSESYGATTAALTDASGPSGFDSSVWTFTQGCYPRLTSTAETEAARLSASALVMDSTSCLDKLIADATINLLGSTTACFKTDSGYATSGSYSSISGSTLKIGSSEGVDTLCFYSEGVGERLMTIVVTLVTYDGDGTADCPYLIKTKDDLISLANSTTTSGQSFTDTYFLMTNDIDMELDESFVGIGCDSDVPFAGHFDGGGYTIHRLKMPDAVVWTTTPEASSTGYGTPSSSKSSKYQGFIGTLAAEGSLKNLTMAADCQLTEFWSYAGGLVGYCLGAIDSCRNYADVSSYGTVVGGIVGRTAVGATVSNCYNEGTVTCGYTYAGGICGSALILVQNCQNAGDVVVKQLSTYKSGSNLKYAGGITGGMTDGRLENCVNSGTVTAPTYSGGITGLISTAIGSKSPYDNEIEACLNYGSVLSESDTYVGTFAGNSSSREATNDYYDGQISMYASCGNTTVDGVTALTTAELTSGTPLTGFSTDTWDFTEGLYPVLSQFADEDRGAVLRGIIVTLADSQTVADVHAAATLSSADDCTWTLADGSYFIVNGNTLYPPAEVTSVVADTLTATAGAVTKPVYIQAATSSSITAPAADSRSVVSERLYNTAGMPVKEAAADRRDIYIVVRSYDDGSVEASKEAR